MGLLGSRDLSGDPAMAAPIFLIFFQSGLSDVIPIPGEPAGDDYNSRRQRRRRGIRPDPFDPWTDDPDELPLVARELAGYPPPRSLPAASPWGIEGGASAVPQPFGDTIAAMLGRPTAPQPLQARPTAFIGQGTMPLGPPMSPVQEAPEEALARMLRRWTQD